MAPESGTKASLGDPSLLGRNDAVRRIFDQHYKSLLSFLRGRLGRYNEASDLAQEAYLRVCRQQDLDKLQENERSYLFRIAINLLKDRHRRRATRKSATPLVFEQMLQPTAIDEETPQRLLEYKGTLSIVKQTLLAMDPKLRRVFLMRRLRQTSYREIAEEIGVSERTVERYMRRALKLLKEELLKRATAPERRGGSPR